MTRLTAQDFQPEVLQLFDPDVHGDLSRRGFLDQAGRFAGSPAAAAALLALGLTALLARRVRRANAALLDVNAMLQVQSERDPLTGLANRRRLQREMTAMAQRGPLRGSVFLIDIDHAEANRRIEMARRLKAEGERKIEEAFHEGVSQWELGATDKARQQFEKVLALSPTHPGAKDYLQAVDA